MTFREYRRTPAESRERKMKEGDIIEIVKVCKARECDECGEPAKYKHTYLLNGSRSNPQSSAYGRDDCSWCSDEDKYACEEHKEKVRQDNPIGMRWCSTFTRNERFEHMFLYWEETSKEKIVGLTPTNPKGGESGHK